MFAVLTDNVLIKSLAEAQVNQTVLRQHFGTTRNKRHSICEIILPLERNVILAVSICREKIHNVSVIVIVILIIKAIFFSTALPPSFALT